MARHTAFFLAAILTGVSNVQSDLIVSLTPQGSDVLLEWTGSGIAAAGTGTDLTFTFDGSPFTVSDTFSLTTPVGLSLTRSGLPGPLTSFYDSVQIGSMNTLRLFDSFGIFATSLTVGDAYEEIVQITSGGTPDIAIITGLNPASLNSGSYTSTTGDASAFGSVTLNIAGSASSAAVPEPELFPATMALTLILFWFGQDRRRRQSEAMNLP